MFSFFTSKSKVPLTSRIDPIIRPVLRELDMVPYINEGGCGISVLSMHRWMKKRVKDLDFDIVCAYRKSGKGYDVNRDFMDNNRGELTPPNHVLYRYDGVLYDSQGVEHELNWDCVLSIRTEQNLVRMINNVRPWCQSFDRRTMVPYISRTLDIDLSDVKIEPDEQVDDNESTRYGRSCTYVPVDYRDLSANSRFNPTIVDPIDRLF